MNSLLDRFTVFELAKFIKNSSGEPLSVKGQFGVDLRLLPMPCLTCFLPLLRIDYMYWTTGHQQHVWTRLHEQFMQSGGRTAAAAAHKTNDALAKSLQV